MIFCAHNILMQFESLMRNKLYFLLIHWILAECLMISMCRILYVLKLVLNSNIFLQKRFGLGLPSAAYILKYVTMMIHLTKVYLNKPIRVDGPTVFPMHILVWFCKLIVNFVIFAFYDFIFLPFKIFVWFYISYCYQQCTPSD